jgi:hypothetical protein
MLVGTTTASGSVVEVAAVVVVEITAPVVLVVESATPWLVVAGRTVVSAGSEAAEHPASASSATIATVPDREIKIPLQGC